MAIVTFSRKQFEKDFGKINEDIENKIALFGTPFEDLKDDEVQIEVNPNRPDLLSYHGFKRDFLSFLGKNTGLKKYKVEKPEKDFKVFIDKSVADIRPCTACAIVKGLKFDDDRIKELIEIQEKLHLTMGRNRKKVAIGIYPLEEIKLPITFKAMEPDKIRFIPLEMSKELSGLEILQRHLAGKEYAHLLAGKAKFPIFVDAEEQILSMPPIINSQSTGRVTEKTKDVFIECSGFNFEILKKCLNIITTSLAEMKGKVYQMEIRYRKKEITPNLDSEKIKVSLENVNKLLGLELKEKELKKLLERMGYNYVNGEVEIPAWRNDVLHEVDIIEDVAIAYGYDNFSVEIPEVSTTGTRDENGLIKDKISQILSGLKMIEVSNYHLTTKKDQREKMGIPEKNSNIIEIEDSKTEYTLLRKNLSHMLLKNFSENIDSEYPQEIFETGKIFYLEDEKIVEKESLAVGISPGNFTKVKQVIEYLFRMIDKEIEFKEAEKSPGHLIDGRTAEILFNGKKIGYLGEVHPKTLDAWKIKMPVGILEIELDDVLEGLRG